VTPSPSPTPQLAARGSGVGPATPGEAVGDGPRAVPPPTLPTGTGSVTGPPDGSVDLGDVFDSVADAAAEQAAIIVKPAAAAAVASSFAFPLILMVIVLFFLVVQPRMDGRDPKLRNAPRSTKESLVPFEEEGAL
jgi:hypothetical protein